MRIDQMIAETRNIVTDLVSRANSTLGLSIDREKLDVRFTLTGTSAGCAGRKDGIYYVNFNRRLMIENWQDYLDETIAHEVAHIVIFHLQARNRVKYSAHGKHWQAVMRMLGYEPSRTHSYDISAVSKRHTRKYIYKCECRSYALSGVNHKKGRKVCPICDQEMVFVKTI